MGTFDGKIPNNAEIDIDYVNKDVSFHFPFKYKNQDKGYEINTMYRLAFFIFSFCLVLIVLDKWTLEEPPDNLSKEDTIIYLVYSVTSLAYLSFSTYFLGLFLSRKVSYFIHKHSKIARDNFSKTNAILDFIKKKRKINLERKISPYHYIHDNKLILWDYSISSFRYLLITDNKLKRIYTKSIEKENHKGEHYRFVCIFEFLNNITDGVLIYK